MKRLPILLPLILFTVVFQACKQDEDMVPQNSFTIFYDGVPYTFTNGVIWDYGTEIYRPRHFSHAYLIPNENVFSQRNNYNIPAGDPPLTLSFFLSTPDSDIFKSGTYEFVGEFRDWGSTEAYEAYLSDIEDKYFISDVVVGFDDNGDALIEAEEKHGITSGQVIVTEDYLEFDLSLTNGSKVTGQVSPRFAKSFPPS
ncbi:hypothetical protein [Cyclobacterium lianum]|nr:hypothetical protein [Cyclobacterium lianum]